MFFTEWNSSASVKEITSKGKRKEILTPTTFSLLHATDFADQVENKIIPALKAGFIIISDRYIYTPIARSSVRGIDKNWLHNLFSFTIKPYIVFYLDVDSYNLINRVFQKKILPRLL